MNKSDLIDYIATDALITKSEAGRALDAAIHAIRHALQKGNDVHLNGFGTFSVATRAGRTGRNPRTGETVTIAAARVPKFKPGKHLKDAVN
ncbi:HU family DNA-binding protein [Comamonas terrae]|uniref:HU family DNA-binding protein n=1 Tax=Comamonas terrae TaxID=673548 RepID=A0ABW5URB5_9BURK|nr:HU family DNA-binding protein [Comamonas terrae]